MGAGQITRRPQNSPSQTVFCSPFKQQEQLDYDMWPNSGVFTSTKDIPVSGWTLIKQHNTFRRRHWTIKRSSSLFCILQPFLSTTVFWIRVKPLRPRSTVIQRNASESSTTTAGVSEHISFFRTTPDHTSHNHLIDLGYVTLLHSSYLPTITF